MDSFTSEDYNGFLALFKRVRKKAMRANSAGKWAFSYLRFSSDPQEEGDTLRRQRALLEGWLKRHPDVTLDQSLKAWDGKAVTGFTREHRVNPKYVLAQFQEQVTGGRVPPGSFLIVENLDRLTREHWSEAVPYVLGFIAKGISIVQLSPTEIVYSAEMDQGQLLMMLLELGRAHNESKVKSERVSAAWHAKKEAARQRVPHGNSCPAWIELVDGEYRLRGERARIVEKMFKLSLNGLGSLRIKQQLDREEPPFPGKRWVRGYIAKILRDRTVIGEYQPRKWTGAAWVAAGEPISGYYPSVINETIFYAAQSAAKARSGRTGRPRRRGLGSSPLSGLLWCANDGSKLYTQMDRTRRILISSAGRDREGGADWQCFNLDHFVDGVLSQLREVTAADVFNDPGAAQVQELQGKLRKVKELLAVAVTRFEADPASATWADRIDNYERERRAMEEELRAAQQRAANPVSATWTEAVQLMRREEPDRLRQCLLQTVEQVWTLLVQRDREQRLAAVQVRFVGGGERFYVILSRNPRGWRARTLKAGWVARSLADKLAGEWDLRDREQARQLETALASLDLTDF